jgi:hypothetical protein
VRAGRFQAERDGNKAWQKSKEVETMKKFLMALAAVAFAGTAMAGVNAGGTVFLHDPGVLYTPDITDYCGQGAPLTDCNAADLQIDGTEQWVWKMYAAFPASAQPRLKGMTFGIYYDSAIVLVAGAPCPAGTFELPDSNWPDSGTGNSLVWDVTLTERLVAVYWFAGYNYDGVPAMFSLGVNPGQGVGQFGDDSVPPILDDIADYGALGFMQPGDPACPPEQPEGACCFGTECVITTQANCEANGGEWVGGPCEDDTCQEPPPEGACCRGIVCTIETQANCEAGGGEYQGDGSPCQPNPCEEPNPVEESSWGRIKSNW